MKKADTNFSVSQLAQQANVSTGYVHNVTNGLHKSSKERFEKLLKALPLSPSEISYLSNLNLTCISSKKSEQISALKKLQRFKQYSELNPQETIVFKYFSNWFNLAIRELTSIPEFNLDPKWIQKKLEYTVSIPAIKKSLSFLLKSGIVKLDQSGRVVAPDVKLVANVNIMKIAAIRNHEQMLRLASQSLDKTKKNRRHIKGLTISIGRDQMPDAVKIIEKAFTDLNALAQKTVKAEDVYQCTMALFPLTRESSMEGEKS